jgi:DNA modification methylase
MKTEHRVFHEDARTASSIADESVDLIVTSPPYPMIQMWDEAFAAMNPGIAALLTPAEGDAHAPDGTAAFAAMHDELDRVWQQCWRVLRSGGIACINIGDATRTVDGEFALWSNHSRILTSMLAIGFTVLPDVIWRKPTNAPNKFMGSGMLPAGAYVTYEHEYVLVLRKGGKRVFASDDDKARRRRSAYFWEERNVWFSDVWLDLVGTKQSSLDADTRSRSGAFPFELPYRLIQMYSVYGDTILDPFLGTGTTCAAALTSARNSIGLEIDSTYADVIRRNLLAAPAHGRSRIDRRLDAHTNFASEREKAGKTIKHRSERYGFPVVTRQETEMELLWPVDIDEVASGRFETTHATERWVQKSFVE